MLATATTEVLATVEVRHDELAERAARVSLRRQIARIERRIGLLAVELWESGRAALPQRMPVRRDGGRLLGFAELEAIRDELVEEVRIAELSLRDRAEAQALAQARLEALLAEPESHRFEVVRLEQLGEPGCGAYHALPRFGLLGILFGWWCVKLSSGCP